MRFIYGEFFMFLKTRKSKINIRLGLALKLSLAIGTIVGILIITSVISILEFRRMSTYVSDQIADNITSINLSAELGVKVDEYNLKLLYAVGRADELKQLDFNPQEILEECSPMMESISQMRYAKADSLLVSYEDYLSTSLQMDSIIVNDFVDTRDWYFTVLQPKYNNFRQDLDELNLRIYDNLKVNSIGFDESIYRSIMPSIISVFAAIVLCLLLQFYITSYYVIPLGRMLREMENYMHNSLPYSNNFEGDDELKQLNANIADIIDENISLKNRIKNRES